MKVIFLAIFLFLCISAANGMYGTTYTRGTGISRCFYGERGSLTATCENATASYFRATTYRFDSLDETLRCLNCNLDKIVSNAFDISGNHILNLDLRNSNITELASSSFVGLVYMTQLDLSNNNIKTIIPGTFKGIKKLVSLNMGFNKISVLVNGAFSELGNLTMLFLNDNEITMVDSGSFDKLGVLRELYLQNNKIKHFENSSMGLSKIELLNLANNDIINLLPEDINSTTLLDLNLAGNKLKILNEGTIIAPQLAMLNISSNQIETISPLAFKGCTGLEYIDLKNNKLKVLYQSAFTRLYSLRNINLAYNNLTVLQTSIFTHLPELRYLNVSYNQINGISRKGVLPMHSLHTLDISHNNLSYFDFKLLFNHAPRLVLVHLEYNNIPCYIIKDMLEYFKHDGIEFSTDDKFTLQNTSCNTTAIRPSEYEYDYKDAETRTDKLVTSVPNTSSPNVYIIYSFLFIIVGLIVVLFYLQYKTYLNLKYSHQGGGDIAQVGLMSSRGLESRDNDY